MAILSAKDISFIYHSKYQKVQALSHVSCEFEAGQFYAIIGQSGSGKTTLLSMLAGLVTPSQGEVMFNGQSVKEIGSVRHRRENVSVIYQAFNLFPRLTILENVIYPMRNRGLPRNTAKSRARALLRTVGLDDVDDRKMPAMLSGGQQQRVAIARALASDAKVLLADEPTGNLDSENSQLIVELLKRLAREENRCVIVVTHDLDISRQTDAIYQMRDGHIQTEKDG